MCEVNRLSGYVDLFTFVFCDAKSKGIRVEINAETQGLKHWAGLALERDSKRRIQKTVTGNFIHIFANLC
jgi:hypothetical protein